MCTRIVYHGDNEMIVTARSMDWRDEIPACMWVFPRGIERNGSVGENSIVWTSRYGSLITSAFNMSSTDGMNEKGLVANLLWLAEANYPEYKGQMPGLSVSAWVQYVLDNYATVSETVEALKKEPFVIVSADIPGTQRFATLHLSISDSIGDSAIFEYIDGKLVIHHSRQYNVMTNSPVFNQQLALNEYWQQIGGFTMLPGTNRAADRFVRASFYIDVIPKVSDTRTAIAGVFSVIRNVSVPLGIHSDNEPNLSSTRWRSVSDHKNLRYYFETTSNPNTFWVDMNALNFDEKQPVKKLAINNGLFSGNMADSFIDSDPFIFAGI
ncbi:linear amide C-N hydrolase [Vibrio sp.]|uniref:linear amide C-N hydrolase n=1 Tax=Vibrio sp. TaxID=678 RepID=UPI003AA94DB9